MVVVKYDDEREVSKDKDIVKELEELKFGSFYIVDVEGFTKITKKEIKIKEKIAWQFQN